MAELRDRHRDEISPIVISGRIGPQDDGYDPKRKLSADEAAEYHSTQIGTLRRHRGRHGRGAHADLRRARRSGSREPRRPRGSRRRSRSPLETDGTLPSGEPLSQAIEETDAATGGGPAYYMINCAHPTHFESVLGGSWTTRIRGLRANASTKSHAELDEATGAGRRRSRGPRRALRAVSASQLPERSMCSAAAAAPTTGTSHGSAAPGRPQPPDRPASVDQPPGDRPAAELVAVRELELAQYRADVGLDRLRAMSSRRAISLYR